MKKIKLIILFFGVLFVSCSEDEYVEYTAPDELSDVSWAISLDKFATDPFSVNVDTFMSFFDLSQGVITREWSVEDGNHFLKEGFTSSDTLSNFIDEDAGLSIDTEKAHVLFENSGLNTVRLRNTFKEPVSYNSPDGKFNAVKEGDVWVIDTTFTFDVYAKILPAFRVLQNDEEILNVTEEDYPKLTDEDTWPIVEVEAGAELVFENLTTVGRPNKTEWVIPDGVPGLSEEETATIKFFKLGTFNAGTLRSSRINELPRYNTNKLIPLKVNVIKSSQPFQFSGSLTEDANQVISFRVNGETQEFSGQESQFEVHVVNEAAGYDQIVPVQIARVKSSDATFIELVLSTPVYNSDTILVSYSGNGNIMSTDERTLGAFSEEEVEMHIGNNILKSGSWAGFEVYHAALNRGHLGPNGAFWVGPNGTEADPNWVRDEFKKYEGTASVKFSVDGLAGNKFQLFAYGLGTIDLVPSGTYEVSYKVFKESGDINKFVTLGDIAPEFNMPWDITAVPDGEWTKVKQIVTVTDDISTKLKLTILIDSVDNPNGLNGRQTIYFDDFSMKVVEVRN